MLFRSADPRFEVALSAVNKIKDNKTREFAFNILGQFQLDNWNRLQ